MYRNKVNREASRLRRRFFQAKVDGLAGNGSKDWWKHLKLLMGKTGAGSSGDLRGMADAHCGGDLDQLADVINESLRSVSEDLPKLDIAPTQSFKRTWL